MKTILFAVGVLAVVSFRCGAAVVAEEDFESPAAGNGIHDGSLWINQNAGGEAETDDFDAYVDSQSLRVEGITTAALLELDFDGLSTESVLFLDFWVRPSINGASFTETLDFGGAIVGFAGSSGTAEVYGWDEAQTSGNEDRASGYTFSYDTGTDLASGWHRITIRRDYTSGKDVWDIYVDGLMRLGGLEPDTGSDYDSVFFSAAISYPKFVDELLLDETNPLFTDSDKDGIDDAYEAANGMSSSDPDDRDDDDDSDGLLNYEEFIQGKLAAFDDDGSGHIYVDGDAGSDSNNGASAFPLGGSTGPKASVGAGVSAASNGDVVVIVPNTGGYSVGTISTGGNAITIKTTGSVVFN